MRIDYFNPRSREGSDFYTLDNLRRIPDFNPRSREGSDTAPARSLGASEYFNPRSREGSDKTDPETDADGFIFQSTLPRGERQDDLATVARIDKISIHAPARGATVLLRSSCTVVCISIHAPARGATRPDNAD